MAGLNPSMERAPGRIGGRALTAPRILMTWEDWLTFGAALMTFLAVSISIQQANWVNDMPPVVPTALGGLLTGMVAARIRFPSAAIHPAAVLLGAVLVVLVVQTYAEGATLADRLEDFRVRMHEWYVVVRDGDVSNDNLPFITLVHSVMWLSAYIAAWSIYRWHSPWLAVIPGGAVILANIAFLDGQPSAAFVAFLFGALWLIARMHLQRSQARWNRFRIDYPEFISVPATQLTLALSILVIGLAWLVPLGAEARAVEGLWSKVVSPATNQSDHLVRLFHNIDSRKGAQLHTLGDTLPIQGQVELGTKQLFRVSAGDASLLRGTSYAEYTGSGWKAGGRDDTRVDSREFVAAQEDIEFRETRQFPLVQVTVLDHESTLLSPGLPIAANVDAIVEWTDGQRGDVVQIRSRRELGSDDIYTMYGSVSAATEEQLIAAGTDYPSWIVETYLQLPDDVPDRVHGEAENVTAGGQSPYEKAKLLEAHLRTYPYDLLVDSPPAGTDAVDYFLFELKRGYFDYHATAMAVMLRELGIPARVAVGYALDPSEVEVGGQYLIRKDDAYSWVEAYFPQYGWVNFNPTPDRPEGGAGSSFDTPADSEIPVFEDPFEFDIAPTDPNDPSLAPNLPDPVLNSQQSGGGFPWMWVYVFGALLAVAAIIALSVRTAWNWGLGEIQGRARLWAKVQRMAGWAHLGARPNETAREWSRRMGTAIEREPEALQLADAYEETRYGRPDLQRIDDDATNNSYLSLRSTLLSTVLRRGRKPKPKS
jgi:transglutaminase-like putative cysteine protease